MADMSGFTKLCEAFAGGMIAHPDGHQRESLKELIKNNLASTGRVGEMFRFDDIDEQRGYGAEEVRCVLNNYFGKLGLEPIPRKMTYF